MFEIGPIQIQWYSFCILLGMVLAIFIIGKAAKKKNISLDDLTDVLFYEIIIGILGARIYYVIFNLDYYLSSPTEILKIWNGGLAIHGGIIAGLIFLKVYTKKKKMNFLLLLDIMVTGLIIAQSLGRWGNFFNQEAYGRIVEKQFLETTLHLPKFIVKGMYIAGAYREPTFLYESIFSFLGFLTMLGIRKWKKIKTGTITSIYLIWYGVERLIIETFRQDALMLGNIKMAQLVSLISVIIGLVLLLTSNRKNKEYREDKLILTE